MLLLHNIITAIIGSSCVVNDPANPSAALVLNFNLLDNCGGAPVLNGGIPSNNLLNQDPLFVDPTNGDFHLTCNSTQCSPAVDAGDLASDYSLEPSPNGCRVNMGAYGNTAEAATDPNATHCP